MKPRLDLFSPLEESRLKIVVTMMVHRYEYARQIKYTRVVRLQIYGRTLSLESNFYHIFIQVKKNEREPYIDPRVIIPPIPVWGPIPVCPRMVILRGVTVHVGVASSCSRMTLLTGLSDEERVNFARPKRNRYKKNAKKNGTKNRNGQILRTF